LNIDTPHLIKLNSFSKELAKLAGDILNENFGKKISIKYKNTNDPVSSVDIEIQDKLIQKIKNEFPEHRILGEEKTKNQTDSYSDFMWVIDPLDGTKNFINGLPLFASSIGILYKGIPVAGAIFIPWPNNDQGIVLHAFKNSGIFINNVSINKSIIKHDPLIALPGNFSSNVDLGNIRVTGSIAYEIAMVCLGVFDYAVFFAPKLWDVAAGYLLAYESNKKVFRITKNSGLNKIFFPEKIEPDPKLISGWHKNIESNKLEKWSMKIILGSEENIHPIKNYIYNSRFRIFK